VLQRAVPFDGLAVVLHDRMRNEMVLHSAGGTTLPPKDIAVRRRRIPPESHGSRSNRSSSRTSSG
jgi:hypothetical protein